MSILNEVNMILFLCHVIASAPIGFRYRMWPYNNKAYCIKSISMYLVLCSRQTCRDGWKGSEKQYFQRLQDIFSLLNLCLCTLYKMAASLEPVEVYPVCIYQLSYI